MKIEKALEAIKKRISNLSKEEIEKFFPKSTLPKGWLSIEEYLPSMRGSDITQGYSIFKVKDKNGNVFESQVSDHDTWYYIAKENDITHWLNQ